MLARWSRIVIGSTSPERPHFQTKSPFDPTDFVKFRQLVGEEGMEKVLSLTVKLHPGAEDEKEIQSDTTVQENDITFPTNDKLAYKVIEYCWKYGAWEDIALRQSYNRVAKALRLKMRNVHHPRRKKAATNARKKLKTKAGRLVRGP